MLDYIHVKEYIIKANPDVYLGDAVREAMIMALENNICVNLEFGDSKIRIDPEKLIEQVCDQVDLPMSEPSGGE